jgi:hypothetical protein
MLIEISDSTAINALQSVGADWTDRNGKEAVQMVRRLYDYMIDQKIHLPEWVNEPTKNVAEAALAARAALGLLAEDADHPDTSDLTTNALLPRPGAVQHVIVPVTGGFILVGLILAARVKKIGKDGIEFYPGIPKELSKVLNAARSLFGMIS